MRFRVECLEVIFGAEFESEIDFVVSDIGWPLTGCDQFLGVGPDCKITISASKHAIDFV